MKHFGNIIFINGPSSAGKTTLAKALQAELDEPYLHIGIDTMIEMMPVKYNNWTGEEVTSGFYQVKEFDVDGNVASPVKMGEYGIQISNMLMDIVVLLAELGNNVIVDEVCTQAERFAIWREKLEKFKPLYVGICLPVSVLEERERQRTNRLPGSVRGTQICSEIEYDLEIYNGAIKDTVLQIKASLEQLPDS